MSYFDNPVTNQKTVTTAGTPVQLPSQTLSDEDTVVIKAKSSNTGTITVGETSAKALNTSGLNFRLQANEAIEINVQNLTQIWIDATVSGEGVEILIG